MISKNHAALSVFFVVTQIGAWTGCNAIIGNGYGVDDPEAAGDGSPSTDDDGSTAADALADGATDMDGTTTMDGGAVDAFRSDGEVLDTGVDSGCPDNLCPTKLAVATGPQRIALSAAGVYWVTATSVHYVDLALSVSNLALAGVVGTGLKRGLTVAGGVPYVTNPDAAGHGAGQCPAGLGGGCTAFVGSAGFASSVTTDGTNIYVGIFDDGSTAHGGGIWRTALNGTSAAPYTLMTDKVLDVQIIAGPVTYFRTSTGVLFDTISTAPASAASLGTELPLAFVVHGGKLIVATNGNALRICGLAPSCTLLPLQNTSAPPTAVIADDTYIYWAEGTTNGSIHRCDFSGCANSKVIAVGQSSPNDLATDGTYVYWSNFGSGTVADGAIMKRLR
ncbi:MAG: hypothetical protein ABIP39_13535 [Polyangiaceae bacterium]